MSNSEATDELSLDSLIEEKNTHPVQTSSPTKYKPKPVNRRSLRIINVNCQSLIGKKGAWTNLIHTTKPDIIIASETWLNELIGNNELESDHYQIFRRDRQTGMGGGVLIAINSTIDSCEIKTKTDSEIVWAKIYCTGHRDIYVAACYRPNVNDKSFTANWRASLNEIQAERQRAFELTVGGDFNLPGWDWATKSLKQNTHISICMKSSKPFSTTIDSLNISVNQLEEKTLLI